MKEENRSPAIGTKLSAIKGFTDMMASATRIPANKLQHWLDCYYQLRCEYESEESDCEVLHESDTDEGQLTSRSVFFNEERSVNNQADTEKGEELIVAEPTMNEEKNKGKLPIELTDQNIRSNKKRIHSQFLEMRKNGKAKTNDIIRLSNGELTATDISLIVDANPVSYTKYLLLDQVLTKLAESNPD